MNLLPPSFPSIAASLMVAGVSLGAYAQESQTLGTVVVTASGFEQQIKEAPASISVVTREELAKSSYTNLHDALRDIPGLNLVPSDNNSKDISLRGMGAEYTLILVDGKRMSTRETQTNGSTGTDQSWVPPLEAIERIEVVRGPMSSLYGSDAMGGVINIITRKVAKEWMGSIRTEATVQERSESGDAYLGNFYLSGPIVSDVLGLSLSGNYTQREEDAIVSGYNKNSTRALTAKLALTPNKDHDFIAEIGTSKQNYVSTPGRTLELGELLSERDFEREHYSLQHKGRWEGVNSDTYVQQEETKRLSNGMRIENTVFSSNWTAPVGERHLVSTGVSFNKQDLKDPTNGLKDGNGVPLRDAAERKQWAVFAEDEWRIVDSFALTGGLRYDHDSQAGGNVSPRLYGVWTANANWTVKGGVSTGFRAPSLRQTLGDWGATSRGGDRYGNPNLSPEKSLSKELGVIYDTNHGLLASLTVFDNEFEDKITRVACASCGAPNGFGRLPTTFVNVDSAITRGIEATLATELTKSLQLKSSYTFTKSEQKSGEFEGRPLNQLPRHLFNVALDWNPNGQVNAWTKVSYRGKESDSSGAASSGSFNQKGYGLVDVGGSYKLNKTVTFYAGIYNILDKAIIADGVNFDTVEDGRRYWLGMNVKF